jgi:hypothetical protein
MTVIQLSAGKKHTIKVGDKELEVTLRPGEVRYEPFLRQVPEIPKVERTQLPKKPGVAPIAKATYETWSRERPKPTFNDIIALIEGLRGRRDLGFKVVFDNLVSTLKKYRK